MGSLLAIGLHTLPLSRRAWLMLGLAGILIGFPAAATIAGGTAFLDTALTAGFGGAVLVFIASTGARNPLNAAMRRGPLAYLRPRQLRHVHDPHHGVHLLRLVRPRAWMRTASPAISPWSHSGWQPPPRSQRHCGTGSNRGFSNSSGASHDHHALARRRQTRASGSLSRPTQKKEACHSCLLCQFWF